MRAIQLDAEDVAQLGPEHHAMDAIEQIIRALERAGARDIGIEAQTFSRVEARRAGVAVTSTYPEPVNVKRGVYTSMRPGVLGPP